MMRTLLNHRKIDSPTGSSLNLIFSIKGHHEIALKRLTRYDDFLWRGGWLLAYCVDIYDVLVHRYEESTAMNRSLSTDSIIESILMKPRSSSFFMPKQYTSTGFLFQKKDSRDLFTSPASTRKSKNRHQACEFLVSM